MKLLFKPLALLAACVAVLSCGKKQDTPFEMPEVGLPRIPAHTVTLTDFDAVGDGVTDNTEAFRKAFEALDGKGGGRLIVPDGIWLTGPIGLKSHTELHLEDNAIIVFSTNQDLYPIIDTNFEGLDVRRCLSPIYADGETDIAITGKGIIDGNGAAWRELKRRKVGDDTWKAMTKGHGVLSEDGSVWYPDEGYRRARLTAGSLNYQDQSLPEDEIKTFLRPVMVSIKNCERVLLKDATFQNSACWNIHPLWSRDITIQGITVRNPHYSTNGDGIDIEACENVILTGSSFDVGDDAICIKSGKDADGRRHGRKCRNLVITDCTVYHGHGGFVVGSEMSGGVENILVKGCRFMGTDVGLRFKSTRGRGGLVKDIWCEDIYMKDIVTYGVIFNLYYAGVAATDLKEGGEPDILPVDETTPEFRDMHFSGIVCSGAKQAIYINGLPELPISGLDFHSSTFTAKKGAEVHFAKDITFDNVTVNGKQI